jgi:hypothetical protein
LIRAGLVGSTCLALEVIGWKFFLWKERFLTTSVALDHAGGSQLSSSMLWIQFLTLKQVPALDCAEPTGV